MELINRSLLHLALGAVFLAALPGFLANLCVSSGTATSEVLPVHELAGAESFPEVAWELLRFDGARRVTKCQLMISAENVKVIQNRYGSTADVRPVAVTIEASRQLKVLEETVLRPTGCLHRVMPKGTYGGAGGNLTIGKLTITTDKDSFVIGLTPDGFALGRETADYHNAFYSGALAEFVAALYYDERNLPFSESVVSLLSGEREIRERRHQFRQIFGCLSRD